MEWLSVATALLVQVTDTDTVRPVPAVTPVIVIEDDVLDPLNPVPTLHA